MDDDLKHVLLVILSFVLGTVIVVSFCVAGSEITKDGEARRCAEYNYHCEGQ